MAANVSHSSIKLRSTLRMVMSYQCEPAITRDHRGELQRRLACIRVKS